MRTQNTKVDLSSFEITHEKFMEKAESAMRMAEQVTMNSENDSSPAMLIVAREAEESGMSDDQLLILVIADGFETDESKRKTLFNIGELVFKKHLFPIACFMMVEAWMAKHKMEEANARLVPPSQDPNRIEVLMVSGNTMRKDESILISKQIDRDKDGKITGFSNEIRTEKANMLLMNHFWNGYWFNDEAKRIKKSYEI